MQFPYGNSHGGREFLAGRAQPEERHDKQVQGDGRVGLLHLGKTRLAGLEHRCGRGLGDPAAGADFAQLPAQSQFRFDGRHVGVAEESVIRAEGGSHDTEFDFADNGPSEEGTPGLGQRAGEPGGGEPVKPRDGEVPTGEG